MVTQLASVYAIEHTPTGRLYVGSAANTSKRWSRHRAELRDGKHRNAHLQATWSRDGAAAFRWRVLAVVEPSERIALEQRVIDTLGVCDPSRGFNRASIAGVSYGGGKWVRTPEWRDAQSVIQRAAKAGRRLQKGDTCPHGHVIDGTYVRRRTGRTGRVDVFLRCQECERTAARERERRKRGIPPSHPPRKHWNQRGGR